MASIGVQYGYTLAASDQGVADMQTAINRFAGPAGFALLDVDGDAGDLTLAAARASARWIIANFPGADSGVAGTVASAADPSVLMQNVADITRLWNSLADQRGFAYVAPPRRSDGGGSGSTAPAASTAAAMAQLAAGAAKDTSAEGVFGKVLFVGAGLGALWLLFGNRKRKRK